MPPQLPSSPRDAAYPALGGLQVELVADAGQGVHGSAEDWGAEYVEVRQGSAGTPHSPGTRAPLTFDIAAGYDTFHGTGTRTGTGRARGGFAPAAPGSRPPQETTPLSGACWLGHAPSWFCSGPAAPPAAVVVPSPPRRCRLSPAAPRWCPPGPLPRSFPGVPASAPPLPSPLPAPALPIGRERRSVPPPPPADWSAPRGA